MGMKKNLKEGPVNKNLLMAMANSQMRKANLLVHFTDARKIYWMAMANSHVACMAVRVYTLYVYMPCMAQTVRQ